MPPVPVPANPPSINSLADTKRSSLHHRYVSFDSIDPTAVIQLLWPLSPDTGTLGI